ncbi:hypothetical protein C0992_000118, partial [Termitomyces sp. T32_za158]
PSIETILLQSSFLISSNAIRYLLDELLACGIVGQILIGILFGAPSHLHLLTPEFQRAVVSLGYLGLILLCFQGGTHSSLADLWANKRLSFAVALTGIILPIALSFLLIPLINTPSHAGAADVDALQAFAAGAALSATSLGTSFSIVSGAGLQHEKVGIILSSAAMLDDVVGLVLIAITKSLGSSGEGEGEGQHRQSIGSAIARPVAASVGSVVVLAILLWALRLILPPIRQHTHSWRRRHSPASGLASQLLTLYAAVALGTYAGTSPLFMAFLAGVLVACSSESPHASGALHQRYLQQIQDYILLPFFFASIGFAVPIREMFAPRVVWKGIVYTALMVSAKFLTGAWILLSSESFAGKATSTSTTTTANVTTNNARPVQAPDITRTKAALLVGFAMVARGEVAFLIASIAQSAGIFANSEIYAVIVWAAVLCTVVGPIGTGVVVKAMASRGCEPGYGYRYEAVPTERDVDEIEGV